MNTRHPKLTRIAVFVDGGYFAKASEFYCHHHARRAPLSIPGVLEFIRHRVAREERRDARDCQRVEAHYFRGRFCAEESAAAGMLLRTGLLEDQLVSEGVVTHYLPVQRLGPNGRVGEKGIDVWFALEAFESALKGRCDVLVLVTGDGDYLPLVRKLHPLGTRAMLLAWNYQYRDRHGQMIQNRVSRELLQEVTYPVRMCDLIEQRTTRNDPLISGLFDAPAQAPERRGPIPAPTIHDLNSRQRSVAASEDRTASPTSVLPAVLPPPPPPTPSAVIQLRANGSPSSPTVPFLKPYGQRVQGFITKLVRCGGFGFIKCADARYTGKVWFHVRSLSDAEFDDLDEGMAVEFTLQRGRNTDEAEAIVLLQNGRAIHTPDLGLSL